MRAAKILRCFAFFWVVILSVATFEYIKFKPDTGFLKLKQEAVRSGWYLPAFYSHIFASSVILICGFFQFSKRIAPGSKTHRLLGKIYIYGVLFFAAPGAYVMCFFIGRGTGVFTSFILQNTLWVIFTTWSIFSIRKGDITSHINMGIRSYSLAFAAVTLRFYIWLFHILENGVNIEHSYLFIAVLSWFPNLILVEILIRRNAHTI